MRANAKIFLKGRLVAAADRLHRADTLEELQACLAVQYRLWRRLKLGFCNTCCKHPEISQLADYVLATLGEGGLPDDRSIATLAGINLRAGALIMRNCPRQALAAAARYSETATEGRMRPPEPEPEPDAPHLVGLHSALRAFPHAEAV